MTPASSPYKEILWFTRYVDSKPVQVIAEYHQEWVNGYVATALKNKTGPGASRPVPLSCEEDTPVTPGPNSRPPVPASTAPLRTSFEVRVAALQAAATFAGGKALSTEVSTQDVLRVAAAFERWLLGQER